MVTSAIKDGAERIVSTSSDRVLWRRGSTWSQTDKQRDFLPRLHEMRMIQPRGKSPNPQVRTLHFVSNAADSLMQMNVVDGEEQFVLDLVF